MGTKNNPGKFDCYAKADPDEPLFTLRGKDPSAPYLVRAWAFMRMGDFKSALREFMDMDLDPDVAARIGGYCEKFAEARDCAFAMEEWRSAIKREAAHGQSN